MVKLLQKCPKCDNYTINKFKLLESEEKKNSTESFCDNCNEKLITPHPPKFSMENKYLSYIRRLKEDQRDNS